MTVVVGVDGAGRTHRLRRILAATPSSRWFTGVDDLAAADGLVVVDDAHRLDPAALRALTVAARAGTKLAIARRPTITSRALAELDELAAADGVEVLAPLDRDGVAALLAEVTGRPVSPDVAVRAHEASAGMPVVVALSRDRGALVARMQRCLAVLPEEAAAVARLLALRLDLPDDVLGGAATMRTLKEAGLLEPGGERMIPALADVVLDELSPPERRSLHDTAARAMLATGADPVATATQLRAARIRTPAAAQVYLRAGEQTRFTDPTAALSWFDDATDAGADPTAVAPGRAEAATLLGLTTDVEPGAGRLALVAGAAAAHDGRTARAADALLTAPPPGLLLAVPLLAATGRLGEARDHRPGDGTGPLARFAAAAVVAAEDPEAAVPLLIEAAEDVERATPTAVLPDTPHAIGAVVAVAVGDLATAEHLLTRALTAGIGGPAGAERHRLLLAWARMRAGRYDTALAELRRDIELPGRERLLRAAISAGIARRRGDIAGLHAVWDAVEPVLARRAVDLWQLEAVEELLVAAARLRHRRRVEPVLAALDGIVPPAWRPALGWLRVQVAVADNDPDTVAAQQLPGTLGEAAALWATVLRGETADPDTVHDLTERLADRQLPWEASRLAGQAAITTTDPAAARRLLERARELSDPDKAASPDTAGLSERELEVARMVLAGSTHREIGAQLYISPKTVEHHVARIRGKLGATSRAELLAMLREIVPVR
ncbi:LuxR family transcriptional regulator [Actinophytocola algeriensis]|uniref:DNA-binding CsgD family transcriptional regulator n=1 Tax=Actinophytocola algeriensis TaxID=1768010 RepID=A0A7W7VI52_9PSEU|nr:LuxR family transcriptional regulator [Actinophytocola algeriensis]MBB4910934.1 DNA-binding CsgD family transcriptional regulator [Actinophytocola algeriensis]MBE1473927.1 DNA-binding CsgD family transcriptional regulator [Actinophytocola algeriensis]